MEEVLCKECRESDPSDYWGSKIHCDWYRAYVYPNDTCSHAVRRGYYVSTAICDVLGINQASSVPSAIRDFNTQYLQKSKDTVELVKEYDSIGPKIADAIYADGDDDICNIMYTNYLVSVVNAIKRMEYDKAIRLYKNMLISLCDYYSIKDNIIDSLSNDRELIKKF